MSRGPIRRMGRPKSDVWQIIYMDLMTQIMMFFVILWSISQVASHAKGLTKSIGDTTVHNVSLPGDVLFPTGKAKLTPEGEQVFEKLFSDGTGDVLNFDTGGLSRRVLIIHGHTDNDGAKEDNFVLGFQRALSVYREIKKYGAEIADHAVLCTHADNSPAKDVPLFSGTLTPAQSATVNEAKAKNRRITIEDHVESVGLEGDTKT